MERDIYDLFVRNSHNGLVGQHLLQLGKKVLFLLVNDVVRIGNCHDLVIFGIGELAILYGLFDCG